MSSLDVTDTIAAIASAPGGGIRGIVRVSGPATVQCLSKLFQPADPANSNWISITSPTVIAGRLCLTPDHHLPGRLLLWPTHRSYTRQPTAEFHTFGSPPLLNLALTAICNQGARLAEPGEFTLRAFLSGRIDLTQAEAVLAVIDSRGEDQLKTALRQLAGGLTNPLDQIRSQLIGLVAEIEAGLDFVEEDIEFITIDELTNQLDGINVRMSEIKEQIRSRDVDRLEFTVALVGPPNAGKSSLFNALLGQSRTIVADIEGTTRDFVTDTLHCNGIDVQLIDTAGLDPVDHDSNDSESSGTISGQAQTKSNEQFRQADLRLVCLAADSWHEESVNLQLEICQSVDIVVVTKSDLANNPERLRSQIQNRAVENRVVLTSCSLDRGIESLKDLIGQTAIGMDCARRGVVSSTVARANDSLAAAANSVELALQAARDDLGLEIVAAECRVALDELGRVVGKIYTDDILDQVFGRFCIGK